ncbi:MAG TPA: TonB-dependent receptor [archaeon]|nr:TonB-dependent receptor [archaeon]
MQQKAFVRVALILAAFSTVLTLNLLAQLATGKIEGIVRDKDTGQPLQGVQVQVNGTRLGNISNADGYYFILNVPPGRRALTFNYTGYQKVTVENQLIMAGQTSTVDCSLSSTVVQLEGITVEAESDPLVPRDKTVSKTRLSTEYMSETPANNLNDLLVMEAGVQTGGADALARGLRIRGGSVGQEGMIVDGVMVRNFTADPATLGSGSSEVGQNTFDTTPLDFSVESVEEVDIITGGFQAEYGNVMSGIINIVTKEGGPTFRGDVRYTTDQINPRKADYGYNQLRAGVNGPVSIIPNMYFSASGELKGQADRTPTHADEGFRGVNQDFVDRLNRAVANDPVLGKEVSPFTLEGFQTARAFYDSKTGKSASLFTPGNPVRLPDNWGDFTQLSAKLTYSPLPGLKLLVTENWSRDQYTYPPGEGSGDYFQNGIFTPDDEGWKLSPYFLRGDQELYIPQGRARRTKANNLLFGADLEFLRTTERSANLQFRYSRLHTNEVNNSMLEVNYDRSTFMGWNPHDIRFEVEQYPGRTGPGADIELRAQLMPDGANLYKPGVKYETPFAVSTYNPYTLEYRYLREWQNNYKLDFDLQLNRYNRAKAGIQYTNFENHAFRIRAFSSVREEKGYDYRPQLFGAYVQNRTDLGDFVFDYGLRFDSFHPVDNWGISNADPTGQHVTVKNMHSWSPRFDVGFPVTDKSQLRFSYGVFTQIPNFSLIYSYVEFGGMRNPGDLGFQKTDAYEAGLSYLLGPQMVVDFSAYYRDVEGQVTSQDFFRDYVPNVLDYRIRNWFWGYTNRGMGNTKGIDVKLSRRFSNNLAFNVIYTLQFARFMTTGGLSYDPISDLTIAAPDELTPFNGDRAHQLTLQVNYGFPEDFMAGKLSGEILKNFRAYGIYVLQSGEPTGTRSRDRWYNDLSLRLAKDFYLSGGRKISVFSEIFNALNRKNSVLYPRNYRLDDPSYAAITGGVDLVWESLGEDNDNRVRFNADFNGDGVLTSREAAMGQMAYQFMNSTMDKRAWGLARQIRSGVSLSF